MADGRGGYRKPSNPAPVSGPGALSRRTDGGAATQPQMLPTGQPYGDRKDMQQIQSGAPMQGTDAPPAVPFDAPTQSPDEPVTAGAAMGPGIGPQAAGIQDDEQATVDQLAPLLRSMGVIANLPGSTPQMRSYYRRLQARAQQGG